MKKWVWTGLAGVVVLWSLAAWLMLPAVQRKLEQAARAELGKPEYTNAFDDVKVAFSGQYAELTGRVATQREHELAADIVAKQVRVDGSFINPVEGVSNRIGVDYSLSRLRPRPWLLAVRFSGKSILAGLVPVEWKQRAAEVLTAKLGGATPANAINAGLASDAKPRPAADPNTTLDPKNLPALADGDIAVTSLNGRWQVLKGGSSDGEVADALAGSGAEFSDVAGALAPLRAWQAEEAEKARQATLPPAYAGVVVLPDSLHVFGRAGDDESQRGLLSAIGGAYPRKKMQTSAMKVGGDVRYKSDWAPAVKELPKKDGEAFITAFKAGGKPVVWDGKGDKAGMQKAFADVLPKDFAFDTLWQPYDNWLKAKNAPVAASPPVAAPPASTTPPPVPQLKLAPAPPSTPVVPVPAPPAPTVPAAPKP